MPVHRLHPIRCAAAAALVLASAAASAATVFDYRFETGPNGAAVASLVDSGPNGLNGVASGLLYTDQVPVGGGNFALDARGDFNYAQVNQSPLMALQEFTLSLQARPDAACTGPSNACFIAVNKMLDSGNFLASYGLYYTEAGQFVAEIGYGSGQGLTLTSASSYAIGSGWHQLVLVLDRDVAGATDSVQLYVDGQLQASHLGEMPAIAYGNLGFYIGAGNFLGSPSSDFRRNFNGAIDNVVLLDVAQVVPEPGSWALMLAGAAAVLRLAGRRAR